MERHKVFDGPYQDDTRRIVAVSHDRKILGFGEKLGRNTDRWTHFKASDWEEIKKHIDALLKGGKDGNTERH